jgi:conjugal transfer pilus assembly protein TraU
MLVVCQPVYSSPCDTNGVINPVTDIAWGCIFPVRIGGVVQVGGNEAEIGDSTDSPLCACSRGGIPKLGITMSFWEPARIIDTVSEAYCMMPMGKKLKSTPLGEQGGVFRNAKTGSTTFAQVHYYQFPAWSMLDLFTDVPCLSETEFDIAMMTELIPTWNNDILSMIIHPESVLFANPVAQASCSADAIAATTQGSPINALFWCMGSWGSTYPLSGSISGGDYVQSNAALAARAIFLMGRTGLLKDTNYDGCGFKYPSIWKKQSYKLQLMKPVVDSSCQPIGKSGLLWTGQKQPMIGGDNFSWMMFRKVKCCATLY